MAGIISGLGEALENVFVKASKEEIENASKIIQKNISGDVNNYIGKGLRGASLEDIISHDASFNNIDNINDYIKLASDSDKGTFRDINNFRETHSAAIDEQAKMQKIRDITGVNRRKAAVESSKQVDKEYEDLLRKSEGKTIEDIRSNNPRVKAARESAEQVDKEYDALFNKNTKTESEKVNEIKSNKTINNMSDFARVQDEAKVKKISELTDEDKIRKQLGGFGFDNKEDIDNYISSNAEDRKSILQKQLESRKDRDLDWGEKAMYYKVPQKAAVFGSTAWLVSSMASQKGQQSNAQLYGQQTPYQ